MIGMILKKGFDLFAVELQLLAQRAQEFGQAYGQLTFGCSDRVGGFELICFGKNSQALFGSLGSPQLVSVQELFPTALPSFDQNLWGRKLDDKIPGKIVCPVLKG